MELHVVTAKEIPKRSVIAERTKAEIAPPNVAREEIIDAAWFPHYAILNSGSRGLVTDWEGSNWLKVEQRMIRRNGSLLERVRMMNIVNPRTLST